MCIQQENKVLPELFELVEKEFLTGILGDFSKATKISLSIFDCIIDSDRKLDRSSFKQILPQQIESPFCEESQGAHGTEICQESRFKVASEIVDTYVEKGYKKSFSPYKCPCGLNEVVAPLIIGRKILGFIFVGHCESLQKQSDFNTENKKGGKSDKRFLNLYTTIRLDLAAKWIFQIAEQISKLGHEAKVFRTLSYELKSLTSGQNPNKIFKHVLEKACKVSGCERATLWQCDNDLKKLNFLDRKGLFGLTKKELEKLNAARSYKFSDGVAGHVAKTEKPFEVKDIVRQIDSIKKIGIKNITQYRQGMRSEYAVPVKGHGDSPQVLGVLTVKSPVVGEWPQAIKEGILLLADIVGVTIENAIISEREQCHKTIIEGVRQNVSDHSGFPILQKVTESLKAELKVGAAIIVRQFHRTVTQDEALLEIVAGDLSHKTLLAVAFREVNIKRSGHGLFEKVWDKRKVIKVCRKNNITPSELANCDIFEDRLEDIHSAIAAPILGSPSTDNDTQNGEKEILGYLCFLNKKDDKDNNKKTEFNDIDATMVKAVCESIAILLMYERMMMTAALAIVEALDRRDPANAEHSRRVAEHMQKISEKLVRKEWNQFNLGDIHRAHFIGLLHDVGKIGVPDCVLTGDAAKDDIGKAHRHIHPHASVAIVEQIEGLDPQIVQAISQHHEFYSGKHGYPHKLQGENLCNLARVLGVADVYDSMIRRHGLWRGFSRLAAYIQLLRMSGKKLDPDIVDAFLKTDHFNAVREVLRYKSKNTSSLLSNILVKKNGDNSCFLSQKAACRILYHELDGKGSLGIDPNNITFKHKDNYKCPYEGNFKEISKRIYRARRETRSSINSHERATGAQQAFLHLRWGKEGEAKNFHEIIDEFAMCKQVLPVDMKGNGIGILAPNLSRPLAQVLAKEILSINEIAKPEKAPVIGVACVPHADISGCNCLIGCAMLASNYALDKAQLSGAIVFYEREHARQGI